MLIISRSKMFEYLSKHPVGDVFIRKEDRNPIPQKLLLMFMAEHSDVDICLEELEEYCKRKTFSETHSLSSLEEISSEETGNNKYVIKNNIKPSDSFKDSDDISDLFDLD